LLLPDVMPDEITRTIFSGTGVNNPGQVDDNNVDVLRPANSHADLLLRNLGLLGLAGIVTLQNLQQCLLDQIDLYCKFVHVDLVVLLGAWVLDRKRGPLRRLVVFALDDDGCLGTDARFDREVDAGEAR